MKYYLVTYHTNWADEFDISGFFIVESEDINAHLLERAKDWIDQCPSGKWYFGTNEAVSYADDSWSSAQRTMMRHDPTPEDIMKDYSVSEITEEQHSFLMSEFNGSFGFLGPLEGY